MENIHKKKLKKRLIRTGILFLICAAVSFVSQNVSVVQNKLFWPVSRFFSERLAVIFSCLPISWAELILFTALLFLAVFVIMAIIRTLQSKKFSVLAVYASHLLHTAALMVLFFLLIWGTNYYAPPLETNLNLTTVPATETELLETAYYYLDNMNEWVTQTPRTAQGDLDAGSFYELRFHASQGYTLLAESYSFFYANPAPPKAVISSRLMSFAGISGIYIPFTGEANINTLTPGALLPFTICHELAHRQGVAPEEEANFAAFLACEQNPDARYVYSSYFTAFLYCFNKLTASQQTEMWSAMHPYAQADFQAIWAHNETFEGPIQKAGTQLNDTYLRAMSQPEGVRSYGQVVDLLIAEYKRRALHFSD